MSALLRERRRMARRTALAIVSDLAFHRAEADANTFARVAPAEVDLVRAALREIHAEIERKIMAMDAHRLRRS